MIGNSPLVDPQGPKFNQIVHLMLKTTFFYQTFVIDVSKELPDDQDGQVMAANGSHFEPEDPDQH